MASLGWRRTWVAQKCEVAARLAKGEAGAGYAEAAILVCAAVSALSAELWPGRSGIDRFRFIELLVRLGKDADVCQLISVPLMVRHLKANGRTSEANRVATALNLPETARVLTGPEIDRSEGDVVVACSSLSLEEVRRWSYASVLYDHVRSSYAHEYRPGEMADSWPMTMKADQHVSYINRLMDASASRMERLIHFHAEWLGQLAVARADAVDNEPIVPRTIPSIWWAKGG